MVFPMVSPTILAHFNVLRVGSTPNSCMANRMRRCEGFNPSRTSGRAREIMTDIE